MASIFNGQKKKCLFNSLFEKVNGPLPLGGEGGLSLF